MADRPGELQKRRKDYVRGNPQNCCAGAVCADVRRDHRLPEVENLVCARRCRRVRDPRHPAGAEDPGVDQLERINDDHRHDADCLLFHRIADAEPDRRAAAEQGEERDVGHDPDVPVFRHRLRLH